MPSFANGNGAAKTASPRFQLPALDFKFGSLTEGTNIPPPLPSPIQEEAPDLSKTAQPAADASSSTTATTATNGTQTTPEAQRNGLKHSDPIAPGSPTSTKAPASIRRLFSRSRLNEALYTNGPPDPDDPIDPRPTSQSNASIATDKQSRRSSGWFRRLRGSDGMESGRVSRTFVRPQTASKPVAAAPPKPAGPPAPMLPEFNALGSKVDLSDDAGSLGTDLFKDIK